MLQKRRKYQCFFFYKHKNNTKYNVFENVFDLKYLTGSSNNYNQNQHQNI